MTSTEHVLSVKPFVVRRRVKWGECDPAGVVYTPVFADYVISAAELFYGALFGSGPQMRRELAFETPTRALTFDFRSPLWPDDEFDMTVSVRNISSRTYTLGVLATKAGAEVFESELTPICLMRDERRAIEIPARLRSRLEEYSEL
jgi:acyl-CoA thioester hydrolase